MFTPWKRSRSPLVVPLTTCQGSWVRVSHAKRPGCQARSHASPLTCSSHGCRLAQGTTAAGNQLPSPCQKYSPSYSHTAPCRRYGQVHPTSGFCHSPQSTDTTRLGFAPSNALVTQPTAFDTLPRCPVIKRPLWESVTALPTPLCIHLFKVTHKSSRSLRAALEETEVEDRRQPAPRVEGGWETPGSRAASWAGTLRSQATGSKKAAQWFSRTALEALKVTPFFFFFFYPWGWSTPKQRGHGHGAR